MTDLALQLLTQFGLPIACLIALALHHVKVVKNKDIEITRLNEARVEEKETSTQQLLVIMSEFNKLASEQNETLALLKASRRPSHR